MPETDAMLPAAELRAVRAEAEVARLRAGEASKPVAEGVRLDPAAWIRRWNDASPEKRLAWANRILDLLAEESRCFLLDHDGAVERVSEMELTLSRVMDLVDQLNVRAAEAQAAGASGEEKRWRSLADMVSTALDPGAEQT
ncbi:hypothetical protein Aph01nite_43480 [Acrocarpospora phusangensis]|uniref:Uncharacterized protein n=1 Tax=Acrocarpospora phusangensis TaxID=1070424 RepID=A0A919QEJ9_9ACTN|nr:hypothetical protein [Acrocarpospora phusangensis]GIH26038.1 hypothetical protein Aph01nite_43480 [Acrocarpospora phusangensis]